ncbi:TPA: RusA family crossover junction endodeoxyribonuclease [Streptococcus suis]
MGKKVIYIPGPVVPKGRPRFVLNKYTGRPDVYTPKRTKDYEKHVSNCAKAVVKNPIEGYIQVTIKIYFAPTKSWTKKKKEQAHNGEIKPHVADIDNMAKSILDGLNKIAFPDDKFIYKLNLEKGFGDKDEAIVIIETVESEVDNV